MIEAMKTLKLKAHSDDICKISIFALYAILPPNNKALPNDKVVPNEIAAALFELLLASYTTIADMELIL